MKRKHALGCAFFMIKNIKNVVFSYCFDCKYTIFVIKVYTIIDI